MDNRITFEDLFEQNRRRIHYQIHKMRIDDPYEEFFQEGLIAMWQAYETYQPDKGPMATYFNYTIRNRLIDRLRKETSYRNTQNNGMNDQIQQMTDGSHHRQQDNLKPLTSRCHLPLSDPTLWKILKSQLTERQWKWMYYHIIEGLSYKEIAIMENTTVEAVKSWGKQVRTKLRDPKFRSGLGWDEVV